jgi:large subunit ribosomal protein L6
MSRLGKKPVVLPKGVTATFAGGVLALKGPKGEISRVFTDDIKITLAEREGENGKQTEITLLPAVESNYTRALWGTYAAHIYYMITGVTEGFMKKLEIEGVGYRAEMKGNTLGLSVGFSHPVAIAIPAGLTVAVEKNVVTVSGIDKDVVGQFAAIVRLQKPPEPYKGKGIRYADEYVLRKQGKRATA